MKVMKKTFIVTSAINAISSKPILEAQVLMTRKYSSSVSFLTREAHAQHELS